MFVLFLQEMRNLHDRPISLQKVANILNIGCKTASGLEAITMARDCRWDELESYCMQDSKLTYDIVQALDSFGLEEVFQNASYI